MNLSLKVSKQKLSKWGGCSNCDSIDLCSNGARHGSGQQREHISGTVAWT